MTSISMNEWLHSNGLEQFAEILSNNGYTDLESLLEIQYDDLVQISIPKKDRKKLMNSIAKHKEFSSKTDKKKEFITTSVDRTCSYGSEDHTLNSKENIKKDATKRNEVNDNIIDEFGKLDTSNTLSDVDDDQTPRRGRSNSDSSDMRVTLKVPDFKRGRSGDRLMFHKKIEGVLSVKKPGFLGLTKRWEPRWCIFDGRRFMAFKSKLETTPLVNIDVTKAIVGSVIGRKGNLNMLEIIAEGKRSLWLGSDIETWINILERVSYYDLNSKRRTSDITIHHGMSSSEEEKLSLDVATESEDRLAGSTDKFYLDMRKRKYKRRMHEEFNEEFYKKALESYQKDVHIEEDYPSEEMEEDDENAQHQMEEEFSVVIIKPNDNGKPKWCKRWCVYDGSTTIKTFDLRDKKNPNASPLSIFDLSTVAVSSCFLNNSLCIEFVLEDMKEIWKGSNIHHWIGPLEKVAGKDLPPIMDGVLVRKKWRPDGQWVARYCSYNGHQFQIYRRKGDKLPLKMYPSRNCSARKISSHENMFELLVEGEVKWVWWNGDNSEIKVNWAQIIRERHEKAVADASRNDPDDYEDESEEEDESDYHLVTSSETMKGTLMIRGQKKMWESKHCELRGRVLYIYKVKGTKKTLELEIKINKANVKVSKTNEKEDKVIEIHHSNNKKLFLKGKESDKWLEAIKNALTFPKKKPLAIKTFSDLSAAESRSEEKSVGRFKDTEIQDSSSP